MRWFLRGLTPVLSVTVALWNPTETQSGLTGSRGLDALPSPSPFVADTQTHSLETSHSCVTQAGVKTVQRWEDDVMAPRRGTCDPVLDPVQVHTQRGTHTQHIYVHNPPYAHKDTEYFLTANNTCCPEETAELLWRLLRGSVSQWLAWIRAHSDRIWGLRLNMLAKRKCTLPHK